MTLTEYQTVKKLYKHFINETDNDSCIKKVVEPIFKAIEEL